MAANYGTTAYTRYLQRATMMAGEVDKCKKEAINYFNASESATTLDDLKKARIQQRASATMTRTRIVSYFKILNDWREDIERIRETTQSQKKADEAAAYDTFINADLDKYCPDTLDADLELLFSDHEAKMTMKEQMIILANPPPPPPVPPAPQAPIVHQVIATPREMQIPISINRVKIPTFDGSRLMWAEFWSLFNRYVVESTDLSETAKMLLLKEYLVGPPLRLISYIISSDEDALQTALELLKEKYDDQSSFKDACFEELAKLSMREGDVASEQNCILGIKAILGRLKVRGDEDHDMSRVVRHLITAKFSNDIADAVESEESRSGQKMPLKELIRFVEVEIEIKMRREERLGTPMGGAHRI